MTEVSISSGAKVRLVLKEEGKPDAELLMDKPKMGAVLDFEEQMEAVQVKGGAGALRVVGEFLVACGMPKDVLRAMDAEQVETVLSALMPSKKK